LQGAKLNARGGCGPKSDEAYLRAGHPLYKEVCGGSALWGKFDGLLSRLTFYAAILVFVVALTATMRSQPSAEHEAGRAAAIGEHGAPAETSPSGQAATPVPRQGQWFQRPNLPVVVAYRLVCSLANEDAAAASIKWLDAAGSVEADGKSFWLFGDSFLFGEPGQEPYLPAPVAVSTDNDGSDCVSVTYKASDGRAVPLFPTKGDETTAWPDGSIALEPGHVNFYFASVIRESPTEWDVRHIGLGRFDTQKMRGERVVEKLWDADSGFGAAVNGARSPIRLGEYVVVFLHTSDGRHILARAPVRSLGEASAYSYWTGNSWSPDAAAARSLWDEPESPFPKHNGLSVRYNEFLGKWLAIYNSDLSTLRVRTADDLTGPWSDEVEWLDCSLVFGDAWPLCYSAEQNSYLARDKDRTLYVTLSSTFPYAAWLVEFRLGAAVHQWRDASGRFAYTTLPLGPGYADEGVSFYASDVPVPGFSAIYAWDKDGERMYSPSSPGPRFLRREVAFYAPTSPRVVGSRVAYDPVYRWDSGPSHIYSPAPTGLEAVGYERGPVTFYAVCGDANLDRVSDCLQ